MPLGSARIAPSRGSDIPAITAIYADAVVHGAASFELEPPDEAEMARRRAGLVEGGYPYLVAEHEGVMLGYAYAGPYRPRAAYRSTVEDSVYVAPASQGRGVGRTLLTALLAECERLDFRLMVAVIGDEASTGSIALHRGLGFTCAGTLPGIGYKHGRWLATVLMHKAIGPGTSTLPTRAV
jgi:L-amino acid N-acyltransferase YncA